MGRRARLLAITIISFFGITIIGFVKIAQSQDLQRIYGNFSPFGCMDVLIVRAKIWIVAASPGVITPPGS